MFWGWPQVSATISTLQHIHNYPWTSRSCTRTRHISLTIFRIAISPTLAKMTDTVPKEGLPARPAGLTDSPAAKPKFDPKTAIEPHILAKLDPEFVEAFTHMMNTNPPPPRDQMTMEAIRADPKKTAPPCALDTKGYPRTADKEVVSQDGAKIPVRVYYPEESKYGQGPYPVHLNFHGTQCLSSVLVFTQLLIRIQVAASSWVICPTRQLCA